MTKNIIRDGKKIKHSESEEKFHACLWDMRTFNKTHFKKEKKNPDKIQSKIGKLQVKSHR